jgi:hypothetical protein
MLDLPKLIPQVIFAGTELDKVRERVSNKVSSPVKTVIKKRLEYLSSLHQAPASKFEFNDAEFKANITSFIDSLITMQIVNKLDQANKQEHGNVLPLGEQIKTKAINNLNDSLEQTLKAAIPDEIEDVLENDQTSAQGKIAAKDREVEILKNQLSLDLDADKLLADDTSLKTALKNNEYPISFMQHKHTLKFLKDQLSAAQDLEDLKVPLEALVNKKKIYERFINIKRKDFSHDDRFSNAFSEDEYLNFELVKAKLHDLSSLDSALKSVTGLVGLDEQQHYENAKNILLDSVGLKFNSGTPVDLQKKIITFALENHENFLETDRQHEIIKFKYEDEPSNLSENAFLKSSLLKSQEAFYAKYMMMLKIKDAPLLKDSITFASTEYFKQTENLSDEQALDRTAKLYNLAPNEVVESNLNYLFAFLKVHACAEIDPNNARLQMIKDKASSLIKKFKSVNDFFKTMTLRAIITKNKEIKDDYEDLADLVMFAAGLSQDSYDKKKNTLQVNPNVAQADIDFINSLRPQIQAGKVSEADQARFKEIIGDNLTEFLEQAHHLVKKETFDDYKFAYQRDPIKLKADFSKYYEARLAQFADYKKMPAEYLKNLSPDMQKQFSKVCEKGLNEVDEIVNRLYEADIGLGS